MEKLNLPSYPFRYKNVGQRKYIFDSFRKKYVVLTPEEEVRQHFAMFLVNQCRYPAARIGLEIRIRTKLLERRSDIVVYNDSFKPGMIVECKAPSVEIEESIFDQAVRYHMELHAPYIAVTNGIRHFCCVIDNETAKWHFVDHFPAYGELQANQPDREV